MQPFVCDGLHMKNATWSFVDDYGFKVNVDGRCHSGRRHGQFNFYIDNQMIAKTKFIKGVENKTACKATGREERTSLAQCMQTYAELKNQNR